MPAPTSAASSPGRPALTWRDVAGVRLPFSPTDGPRITDQGRAAGYSPTVEGAALAAVQVLTRTSASAGPDIFRPVVAEQIIGADADLLAETLDAQYDQLRRQRKVTAAYGRPIPGNDAEVLGYRVRPGSMEATAQTAAIDVLLTSPSLGAGQVIAFSVSLEWVRHDWRVVAPPQGDWGSVATLLNQAPAGALRYGQA
jgi:hypothetical protein